MFPQRILVRHLHMGELIDDSLTTVRYFLPFTPNRWIRAARHVDSSRIWELRPSPGRVCWCRRRGCAGCCSWCSSLRVSASARTAGRGYWSRVRTACASDTIQFHWGPASSWSRTRPRLVARTPRRTSAGPCATSEDDWRSANNWNCEIIHRTLTFRYLLNIAAHFSLPIKIQAYATSHGFRILMNFALKISHRYK